MTVEWQEGHLASE